LVDGPSEDKDQAVPRHSAALANISLTSLVVPKLPRAIGHGPLKAKWKDAEVEKKWKESSFAKGRVQSSKRRGLTDFERFKVLRLRKQVRWAHRLSLAKIRRAAS